jgi:hypothetical protein
MAQNEVLTRTRPAPVRTGVSQHKFANPTSSPRVSRTKFALVLRIVVSITFVLLSCSAILYPLSHVGGNFARARGHIATLDPTVPKLTYQTGSTTASVEVTAPIKVYLNGHPTTFDALQVGDHVLVKYESLWKRSALEIHAIGRRP